MRTSLPYALLRNALRAHRYNQEDVAALLERSRQYVSDRLNAKGAWQLDEAYKLLEAIDTEDNELWRYFPADPHMVIERPKPQTGRLFRLVEEPAEMSTL